MNRAISLALCFCAALLEGFDLQSTGLAAGRMGHALQLGAGKMGLVFSIGALGLLPGAAVGGHLADRLGRKKALIASLLIYGVFSLLTAGVHGDATLMLARFMTGLGLGGALPSLIAICSEVAAINFRSRAISVMYAGVPLGGLLAGIVSLSAAGPDGWRIIFLSGGIAPLLLTPAIVLLLPEPGVARATPPGRSLGAPMPIGRALFGDGRAGVTVALWLAYFLTLYVVYLLVNWLPSLLIGKGLSHTQAGEVQMVFNGGAALGTLLFGLMLDRLPRRVTVLVMYGGMIAALAALAEVAELPGAFAAGFAAGGFVVGGQLVLYALAPDCYDGPIRGTGVGAAIAAGRLGAVAGPLVGGQILAHALPASVVLLAAIPGILLAAGAVLIISARPRAA